MELSNRAFHAVSDVVRGARYSMVFGFWERTHLPRMGKLPTFATSISSIPNIEPLLEFLERKGAKAISHLGRTLFDHLIGTAGLLWHWGCGEVICRAGLFHSVYGANDFTTTIVDPMQRSQVGELIGAEAERLAFLYGTIQFGDVYREPGDIRRYSAIDKRGTRTETLTEDDICGLNLISWANMIDQGTFSQITPDDIVGCREVIQKLEHRLPTQAFTELRALFQGA
jgi:hypothetical protein